MNPPSPSSNRHSPRTVLITGAAGGIGRATVLVFAQAGWRVIGVDRSPYAAPFPENGLYIQSDSSQPQDLENAYRQVGEFTASLSALVNNAAIQIPKPLLETSVEEWDAVMVNNLRSAFLNAKLAHPLLKAAGEAAIVNMSSV
ncbi:MAG TPA: SDR family oxidoreductase, partial [Anaerolineales bacterium]